LVIVQGVKVSRRLTTAIVPALAWPRTSLFSCRRISGTSSVMS
jgi:hypothetical protein